MKALRLITLFVFLLAGCATTPPISTLTAAPAQPSQTPSPLPLLPTETTLPPSATPAPTATAMPATSTPNAQEQERNTVAPIIGPCDFAEQPITYSPSQSWVMTTCRGEKPEDGLITKFARVDGTQHWDISFNQVYIQAYHPNAANLDALLQKTFIPARWTKDEAFVYLGVQTSDEETPYKGYEGLFRLDLNSGQTRPMLKPATAPLTASYAFKFSPSGTKLAYLNQAVSPISIIIEDTTTGSTYQKMTLDTRFTQGGSLLWSPDEKQLIVSLLDANINGGNAVVLYDLTAGTNKYIIQQDEGTYLPLAWIDLTTIYAESYPGSWVYINLSTKEITEAPAPTPAP